MDISECGRISKANFEQCCTQAGVNNFTAEDLSNVARIYGVEDDLIDYV